jgi:hypothetical protein
VIGDSTVKLDREERILGLRQAAEASEKLISARDRVFFDAYARGVNAFIYSHRDRLSLEFRLLKYTPRPWTITDSLLIGARMVQDLNHYSYARALDREKILAKLGPELTADLYVNSSWRDRPPTEVRGMEDDPGAHSGDEDDNDNDDEEIEPEGGPGRITSAPESQSEFVGALRASVPQGLKPNLLQALSGTAKAVPFPFVLDHSSWVSRRRGKPRLYARAGRGVAPSPHEQFFRRLFSRALSKPIQTAPLSFIAWAVPRPALLCQCPRDGFPV